MKVPLVNDKGGEVVGSECERPLFRCCLGPYVFDHMINVAEHIDTQKELNCRVLRYTIPRTLTSRHNRA